MDAITADGGREFIDFVNALSVPLIALLIVGSKDCGKCRNRNYNFLRVNRNIMLYIRNQKPIASYFPSVIS